MTHLIRVACFQAFLFAFSLPVFSQTNNSYERVYLSGKDVASAVQWDFKVSDGRNAGIWSKIPVPSNWELQGFGTFNYGHDHKDSKIKLGKEIGNYKTEFYADKDWKGKVIQLVFDGVMTDTEVKVNGKIVGDIHQGGFYRFKYDISKYLDFDDQNVLEVKVSKVSENESVNKAERESDFWIFGGIFRPVFLEILPKYHFSRIALNPKAGGEFQAVLTLDKYPKNARVDVELKTADEQTSLGKFSQVVNSDSVWLNHQFENVSSWNPESPKMYTAIFRLMEEGEILFEKKEKLGFRTVELRPKDGIYVNDVRVIFKGVNRHSFYPSTGRALSEENHLEDIRLMKEMNMNAVRMSHYIPDERFLELADSLGLFVLDEVTGWQDGYDTEIGPKLIKEAVLKDANHPSVVIWDHGNEGGWNFENEFAFHQYDIQKRPIIYPWLLRNDIDTFHYPTYDTREGRLDKSGEIFMPTEWLHGLYDGGLGAGLNDFWNKYKPNPLFAGGFLWVFSDEAVKRVDLDGKLDSDGNHAPDGILGPYREKEGSFYTIKSIWSPIQIHGFDSLDNNSKEIEVSNQYLYSDINGCKLQVDIFKIDAWSNLKIESSKEIKLPTVIPGETIKVKLDIPENWQDGDLIQLKSFGIHGELLNTWSKEIRKPKEGNPRYFGKGEFEIYPIKVRESVSDLQIEVDGRIYFFGKKSGNLEMVKVNRKFFYLSQNPLIEGIESQVKDVTWKKLDDGSIQVKSMFDSYPKEVTWTVLPTSELKFVAKAPGQIGAEEELLGVGFIYPEAKMEEANLIANGPYRVWGNRLEGVNFGLWNKKFNNTQTASNFEELIYPEFKGYYSNFHALQIKTADGEIDIRTETPGLFLSLFKPQFPENSTKGVLPVQTKSDISFLYKIPSIGTKFHTAEEMSPKNESTKAFNEELILWFRFR
ncbi:glycoside hydrolase family 2 protein [Algoriphagus machipongonensis]|uniref:beta-galactosidase n=1 Tax=Algoriphagus machipongonensis TaxID=388413 RepID=A3HSH1_9BACT|nr:glycoside hydrolase family 2 TIM barrel-domain containing protein [Algoriphagus machipongonensis]EAZ82789.1 beta-galactosidase [Algoriphagus machipongonensis]